MSCNAKEKRESKAEMWIAFCEFSFLVHQHILNRGFANYLPGSCERSDECATKHVLWCIIMNYDSIVTIKKILWYQQNYVQVDQVEHFSLAILHSQFSDPAYYY